MNATPTTQSLDAVLCAHGFTLKPWRHQKFVESIFGEKSVTKIFGRGSISGLLEYRDDNALYIIAIDNQRPGNGDFLPTIERFEQVVRDQAIELRVVQFWNQRLATWFERREGWRRATNLQLGGYAIFNPNQSANQNT